MTEAGAERQALGAGRSDGAEASRTLRFPPDQRFGTLFSRGRSAERERADVDFDTGSRGWRELAAAQGEVIVPVGGEIGLRVAETELSLSPLATLPADALDALDLFKAKVSDAALVHLAGLTS